MPIPQIPPPKYHTPPSRQPLLANDKEAADAAARSLARAFSWSDTVEGADFWVGVNNRLRQIGLDGILKEF